MAEEMMQQEQGAGAEGGSSEGGEQLSALLSNLAQGSQMLDEVAQSAGVPQLAEKTTQLSGLLEEISQIIAQGPGAAPQDGGGIAAMEAGAGGKPMSPASR